MQKKNCWRVNLTTLTIKKIIPNAIFGPPQKIGRVYKVVSGVSLNDDEYAIIGEWGS